MNDIKPYVMKEDFPSVNKIKKDIKRVEIAISKANKTVRLHQNRKKLEHLNRELRLDIFRHNKFDVFDFVEKIVTEKISEYQRNLFENLAEYKPNGRVFE
ncbi:hypothetical protein P4639_22285 [Priestia megaterium]|uniref:hypothetical protein n=1 Tax=Priestia megaterium TaxID=1404 RepID=UPI002E2356E9|nr:hypothetical protein [Priestia megaterium]